MNPTIKNNVYLQEINEKNIENVRVNRQEYQKETS